MTHRKSFSKKDRARLFSLYEGRCYLCEGKIDGVREAFEIEHVIPWALTQDDSDDNLRLAHVKCHKTKTHGPERAMLNKTERMRLTHLGMWPKAKGNARIKSRGFQNARGVIIPCACLLLLVPALLSGPLAIGYALDIHNMEPMNAEVWSAPR